MLDSARPGSWSFSHIDEKGEMSQNSEFKELLSLLNEAQVRYLVVGGYAVIEHTEPRYTKDLDIWISPDRENAGRVHSALKKFGAPLVNITVDDFTNPEIFYQMGRPPARVDILMGLKGLEFEASWKGRIAATYGGVPTQFLSSQDLIINKRLVGRLQDLTDVENLLLAQKRKSGK
jgi:hypothetical protein